MLKVLLGAAIAAVFAFLGGWLLMRLQARQTTELTLRLRALELQEVALRRLNELTLRVLAFRDLLSRNPPPEASAEENSPVVGMQRVVGAVWRKRWQELVDAASSVPAEWSGELAPAIDEARVASGVDDLRAVAQDLDEALRMYELNRASPEFENLRAKGRQVIEHAQYLHRLISEARRLR